MSVTNLLQSRHVAPEIKGIHDGAHAPDEFAAFRRAVLDLAEPLENAGDVSDLAELNEFVDVTSGRQARGQLWGDRRRVRRRRVVAVEPLDIDERMDLFKSWRRSIGFIMVSS
jgi:hypothetical protein